MVKKAILLLSAALSLGSAANAQWCITDEMNREAKERHPEIEQFEKRLDQELLRMKLVQSKTTADDTVTLHIPVVVHVVHNYSASNYVEDNTIYQMIDQINVVYAGKNADLADVIPPFQKYIGNPKIVFHLATKDPLGRPSKGITHRFSYLTNGGDDQAKFDLWPPDYYLNIWVIDKIGRGLGGGGVVAAYAYQPASAAQNPYIDGIMTAAPFLLGSSKTIEHEFGHYFNLDHTWGGGNVATACGDDDVDDTPPTKGHFGPTANCDLPSVLYDTTCTNVSNTAAKVLLDNPNIQGSKVKVSNENNLNIDFVSRTGLTVDSLQIYPTTRGGIFDIELQKYNGSGFTVVTKVSNNSISPVGKPALSGTPVLNNETADSSASISFTNNRPIRIESVDIYPSTIGDSFKIILYNNADTMALYRGITTTNTGVQTVPVGFFVASGINQGAGRPASNYKLKVVQNPGLYTDNASTLAKADSAIVKPVIGSAIRLTKATDITNQRYNLLYNWQVRYRGVTAIDTAAQWVPLIDFVSGTDSGYRMVVTVNPGLKTDSVSIPLYTKNIPCVLTIKDDTTKSWYNFLYNWQVRWGYIKDCIDYPDTVNTQNIMDYANCPKNFTKGQVARMRAAAQSAVANRGNLLTNATHLFTGILDPATGKYGVKVDLAPVPDFSVEKASSTALSGSHYMCANEAEFSFRNRSWGDTITSVQFEFANGNPATATSTNAVVKTKITQPGWVNIKLTAVGNDRNAPGKSALIERTAVYAADPTNKINPIAGYFQEFSDESENNRWPIFNYYNNAFKWQVVNNTGYYDKSAIMYSAYDIRTGPSAITGAPSTYTPDQVQHTDEDDFFTPPFDLSGMTEGNCNLNYMYSGAYRSQDPNVMKDKLEIAFSTDCGTNWKVMTTRERDGIANKGSYPLYHLPSWMGDWALASINIPADARKEKVLFRFRYKPTGDPEYTYTSGGTSGGFTVQNYGVGNNFYIDRINISNFPLGMNTIVDNSKKVAIAPNPTTGSSYIVIRNSENTTAQVQVTDITGKVVYRTEAKITNAVDRIEVPAAVISVKGIYLVHIITGNQTFTEKLVSH
ncbi:MAG: T9SS type A sorting domain-containing protein [Sphingobacteriales bacterium]|nr:MAG: T9SS type A sorting domain-containing protein [Sphingobacteriales bacterium]